MRPVDYIAIAGFVVAMLYLVAAAKAGKLPQ
jgi:hypothetical protein